MEEHKGTITIKDDSNTQVVPLESGYRPLLDVLLRALEQAQYGKGAVRHANYENPGGILEQPTCTIMNWVGPGFAFGQVIKKTQEAARIEEAYSQDRELLGAIVYAALIIANRKNKEGGGAS